jgi:hypothetical protein
MNGVGDIYNRNNEITSVAFDDTAIVVTMCDGRRLAVPIDWYPWLKRMTPEQRDRVEVLSHALYWEEVNQGMSIEPFLLGQPNTA